jgi:ribosomal protein L29
MKVVSRRLEEFKRMSYEELHDVIEELAEMITELTMEGGHQNLKELKADLKAADRELLKRIF